MEARLTMQCILSIVVPIHNMHQKLNQLNQWISTVPDTSVEVILVDDFTSEESSEEIEKLARFHSRLNMKLISGKFNSPGKARNAGLLEATGVWIIFADSDDTLYVEPVLKFLLKSNPINVEVFQFRELDFNSDAEQLNDGRGAIASARSRAATSMKFATKGFG